MFFFFAEKEKGAESSQEENKPWKAYTNVTWTLNLSRDDPVGINLCVTYKYLKVLNLSFDKN